MLSAARLIAPAARSAIFSNAAVVRPLAAVSTQTQLVPAAPAQLSAVRSFQTTSVTKDIDSAAKFIGAGAATVGVAGSGEFSPFHAYTIIVCLFVMPMIFCTNCA
ncbi:hypothetical protein O3G_MSEX001943 [Manduca sexta]|uniref:Uncharacterized protein n=1 Tax=Manduca sexta TaxID=7130 RepID=A0A922CDH8_MANSE|nr:hypothetical protein O3G_MSEX001943 [Manduca sexta]KAG6441798.1 hypothetical protein O3G_MSEX001943 [Manduca sexta]KAG6441799.1 hypothetical protein O3G_MSEX001943 [Manduca sexta]